MRILVWHVHGAWATSFVHGEHTYLVPVTVNRDADGRGRARTYDWPAAAIEVEPDELRNEQVDVVVLQRPRELELAEKWLGRRPGMDLPAVFVEHNTPKGAVPETRHHLAHRDDIPVVHVTHFNALFWDCGRAPTTVIEHGVIDPGYRYTGEQPRAAVVVNEPIRRWRVAGTDLLAEFATAAPLDVFGMGVRHLPKRFTGDPAALRVFQDLPQRRLHGELAARRVYVHPFRWTSLGLSLIEAMQLGLPVVALATTEAVEAVPAGAGVISTRMDVLLTAVRDFVADPAWARHAGALARVEALKNYSLGRFLEAWDRLLTEVTR